MLYSVLSIPLLCNFADLAACGNADVFPIRGKSMACDRLCAPQLIKGAAVVSTRCSNMLFGMFSGKGVGRHLDQLSDRMNMTSQGKLDGLA